MTKSDLVELLSSELNITSEHADFILKNIEEEKKCPFILTDDVPDDVRHIIEGYHGYK